MFREIISLSKLSEECIRHPFEKLLLSIAPIIIIGFSHRFSPIILNIFVFSLLHLKKKHPIHIVRKFSLGTALFAAISSITFVFDYGLKATILIILKSFSAGMSLSYLSLTTPLDDILNMIYKVDYLKDLCDIAKTMERFIILLEDEYNIMVNSIKSRNGFGSFKLKLANSTKIASLLFINTMKRWQDIKDAINTRCYNGSLSYMTRYKDIDYNNLIFIIIYIAILICMILSNLFF